MLPRLFAVFSILLGSPAQAEDVPHALEYRPLSHAEMDRELRACGLHHLTIYYEDEFQSDVVIIRDVQLSDEQLRCVFVAQDMTGYILEWPQQIRARYHTISSEVYRVRRRAEALAYFAARPELGPIPIRGSGQAEIDYARSIERFCGPGSEGFFDLAYGTLTISSDWLEGVMEKDRSKAFKCIMNAAALTNLRIGFIGNEAFVED